MIGVPVCIVISSIETNENIKILLSSKENMYNIGVTRVKVLDQGVYISNCLNSNT